jgi:hypothetical protein
MAGDAASKSSWTPLAETIARTIPTSLEALRGAITAFVEVGVDE